MEKKYTYIRQGNGVDSWKCEETLNGETINVYMVYDIPYNWGEMRIGLMTSKAFVRALSNPSVINLVAYGALQTVLSTESNEQHLLQMISLTMSFTQDEKDEINAIFEGNNFTIRL